MFGYISSSFSCETNAYNLYAHFYVKLLLCCEYKKLKIKRHSIVQAVRRSIQQRAAFSCFLNCRAQVACYIAVHQASKNLDAMVEESMRDIPSDEEPSGDENDPEFLVSKLL